MFFGIVQGCRIMWGKLSKIYTVCLIAEKDEGRERVEFFM